MKKKKTNAKSTESPGRYNKQKIAQSKQQIRQKSNRSVRRMSLEILSFLIGVAGFLFLVYPRLSVYPSDPLDAHNPFKTPFIIKNDGYLSIQDISYSLSPEHFQINGVSITGPDTFLESTFNQQIDSLKPNNTTIISIDSFVVLPDTVDVARLSLNINYRPYLIPFKMMTRRKFTATRKNTGEYVWLEDYSTK